MWARHQQGENKSTWVQGGRFGSFQTIPTDYLSSLDWKCPTIPQKELDSVTGETVAFLDLLHP